MLITKSKSKEQSVNSNAYAYLLKLLGDKTEVVELRVVGKWLKAKLYHGATFCVKNTG